MYHIKLQAGSCRSDSVIKSTPESFVQVWGNISICLRFYQQPQRERCRSEERRTSIAYSGIQAHYQRSKWSLQIALTRQFTCRYRLLDVVAGIVASAKAVLVLLPSLFSHSYHIYCQYSRLDTVATLYVLAFQIKPYSIAIESK